MDVRVVLTLLTVASRLLTLWGIGHGLATARKRTARALHVTWRLDELSEVHGRERAEQARTTRRSTG
ncbi:hypothetical protein [Cellulomonas sp. NS3]|uniref:hypothetical protein n=1 Tax=Cellulomonas sp. NS3 TaxID=2973977 RepID=UPI002163B6F3|nr:hypothetical protein [Cellulomonas sp. NS3]